MLCEKPVALSADGALSLVEAQKASGLPVAEAFMVRPSPAMAKGSGAGERRPDRRGSRHPDDLFPTSSTIRRMCATRPRSAAVWLYDVGCYALNTARYIFGTEPQRAVALMDRDSRFGTDRLTSGLLAFPEGRQLAFTCSTQLALTQKVTILGTKGRIEIAIPFNAPADAETVIAIDDGRDLVGGGREEIMIEPVDQYRLQADAFAHAVLTGEPLETGLDDAVANMKAIDALFRSARTGLWETPLITSNDIFDPSDEKTRP